MFNLPDLPDVLATSLIQREIEFSLLQHSYFRARAVAGPVVTPVVFQPVFEPDEGRLLAIFREAGAIHLVFLDEIAPNEALNEKYRAERLKIFGRTYDIESVEIGGNGQAFFNGAGVWPLNPYEVPAHATRWETYRGTIYSTTWNHCMSCSEDPLINLRGGYREREAPVYTGGREAAEDYVGRLIKEGGMLK